MKLNLLFGSAVLEMDRRPAGVSKQLLHLDVHVDELEPRRGILDLLRRLRPQWKEQDVKMKARDADYSVLFSVRR